MRGTAAVAIVALAAAVWALYEPMPDFVQSKGQLAVTHLLFNLANAVGSLLERLGLGPSELTRRQFFSLLEEPIANTSSVQFAYRQFGDSRTLVVTPTQEVGRSGGGIVYIHGGGWVLGSPEMAAPLLKEFVARTGAVVFAVRYRLAPEHPFPAAFADCVAAVESIFESAEAEGVDSRRILIGGDSAGGQLAAAVVQQLRHSNSRHRPKLQLLLYPVTQAANLRTESYVRWPRALILRSQHMAAFFSLYLLGDKSATRHFERNGHVTPKLRAAYAEAVGSEMPPQPPQLMDTARLEQLEPLLLDPRVSPLLHPRLQQLQLPPALIIVSEFDPLRDDALMYGRRLRQAGVQVHLRQYQTFHGASHLPDEGREIRDDIVDFINSAL